MFGELVPIERKAGVTLYGRVIGPNGKLGQYEVHSEHLRHDGNVYGLYADAKNRFNAVVGVKSSNKD